MTTSATFGLVQLSILCVAIMGVTGFAPNDWFMLRKFHDRAGDVCGLIAIGAIANAAGMKLNFGD